MSSTDLPFSKVVIAVFNFRFYEFAFYSILRFCKFAREPVQSFVETLPLGGAGCLDVPLQKINGNYCCILNLYLQPIGKLLMPVTHYMFSKGFRVLESIFGKKIATKVKL